MYDEMTGSYEVLSDLEADDFVADPADPGCASGASVVYRDPADFDAVVDAATPTAQTEEGL